MRLAACIVLMAARAWAWGPAEATPSQWVELVEAVRERCEATRYNDAYKVAPENYAQPIKFSLGVIQTNITDEIFGWLGLDPIGPVVCRTNGADVWCWTNHVALDTDYVTWTNDECGWGWAVYPFGPQSSTNLTWTNGDARLAGYGLPAAWTQEPSAALINLVDDAIRRAATNYVDTVAIAEVGGIDAYFQVPSGGWHWIDSDGDEVDDRWYQVPTYPAGLPLYTMSNLWRYAGIEPYRYPSEIVTQTVTRYGWEVGQLSTYSVEETEVRTNRVEVYGFERAPTATTWRVMQAQLWLRVTNTVTTTHGSLVTIDDQFGAVQVAGDPVPPDMVPRLIRGEATIHNRLTLTPPGTGTVWRTALAPAWPVRVVGTAITSTPLWRLSTETNSLTIGYLAWSNGQASAVLPRVYLTGALDAPGWSYTETYVYSNTTLVSRPTESVAGASYELVAEGASYEIGQMASLWRPTLRDWQARAAIVSNLLWTIGPEPAVAFDGWVSGPNTANYEVFSATGNHIRACSSDNDDCWGVSLPESVGPYTSTPRTGAVSSLAWSYDEGNTYIYAETYDGCTSLWSREARYFPAYQWPGVVQAGAGGWTTNLTGTVDMYGRMAGGEIVGVEERYDYENSNSYSVVVSRWPRSVTSVYSYATSDELVEREHVVTFAEDVFGAEELWPRSIWSGAIGSTGGVSFVLSLAPVPSSSFWVEQHDSHAEIIYAADVCDGVTVDAIQTGAKTWRVGNTTARNVSSPVVVVRWEFRHLR